MERTNPMASTKPAGDKMSMTGATLCMSNGSARTPARLMAFVMRPRPENNSRHPIGICNPWGICATKTNNLRKTLGTPRASIPSKSRHRLASSPLRGTGIAPAAGLKAKSRGLARAA